ncbi:MAG: ATP-binding protein [Burkholderiales bacterium]
MQGPLHAPCAQITIRAETRATRHASAWLESVASGEGIPFEQLSRLDHCLDEALANVINHGLRGIEDASILLQLAVQRGGDLCCAELVIVDEGVAFDSTAPDKQASRPATLAEANVGGLGLAMMKSFSDELRYHRADGRNHLTIRVTWTETTGCP